MKPGDVFVTLRPRCWYPWRGNVKATVAGLVTRTFPILAADEVFTIVGVFKVPPGGEVLVLFINRGKIFLCDILDIEMYTRRIVG